ncbi:NB-ARC domain-containing protein [Kutzneria sp. CA-103260]|uniref:NB-ARC domain-containing protein n=1 Tax=Kutzneria sp. CA-103260 TaxID=2802641 RepID=UPI001BA5EF56|nr:NB-ARC domain-containing protein [Kutzneria sp. CA-103260]QUQ68102.1 NTPase-like protein [Kutzneria sp. CA-103260]
MANQASGDLSGTVIQAETIDRVILRAASERLAVGLAAPRPPVCFVNRDGVHREADKRRARAVAAGEPTLICFHGPGGVGTTGAATMWAGRHATEYPDGVHFLKLSNPERDERESAGEALGVVLRAVGLEPDDIAPTADGRAAQLRDFGSDKKMMLVLDDVINAAQVAYFRPTGAGCAVLVTSRWLLQDLGPDFGYVPVPPLATEYAHRLLGELLARHDIELTAEESEIIVRAAGGFPAAIELMACQLIGGSDGKRARFLRRVAERGWNALGDDAKQRLVAHLDIAYGSLDSAAAAAYRALAWHPGADFDIALAAHLIGGDPDDADDALESLAHVGLLTVEDERCRFHDLAQAHARAKTDGPPAELSRRIAEWYLDYTVTFDRLLSDRPRSGPLYRQLSAGRAIARADALACLERERPNLAGAVKSTEAAGHDDLVWQLCEALWGLYHLHGHYEDWITTHELGLNAAQRCGDAEGEMRMASQLGSAYLGIGELDRALECFRISHGVAARIGHRQGQESALEWQGKIALRGGDAREASRCFDLAWAVADDPREFAILRLQRCRALVKLGQFAAGRDEIMAAWQHFQPTTETDNKAKCQLELGRALAGLGEVDAARVAFAEAERLFAEDGSERQRKAAESLRNQLDSVQE